MISRRNYPGILKKRLFLEFSGSWSCVAGEKKRLFFHFPRHPAGEMDTDALTAAVLNTCTNALSEKSRKSYLCKIVMFLIFLAKNNPDRLRDRFRAGILAQLATDVGKKRNAATKIWIETYCKTPDTNPFPLQDDFAWMDLAQFLETRKQENISSEYLGNLKSGIRYLFTLWNKRAMYDSFATNMSNFMRGAKCMLADARQQGKGKVGEGKRPMQFALYDFLGKYLIGKNAIDSIFAHLFMTLSWNLVCRSKNTETIRISHIIWQEDHLAIVFAKQKNDQEGENVDYRAVYANPRRPQVCPVLALAIYFACTSFTDIDASSPLFAGGKDSQASRFSQHMHRLFNSEDMKKHLESNQVDANDLGTHSLRKGAATYCASGSTDCPSIIAIQLRAGWRLEGVTGRYLRFAAAGDQHVGRTVCGLDPMTPEFALLPPFFTKRDPIISAGIKAAFPNAPESLLEVLEFCLASLIYHEEWLRKNLPSDHPLFASPIWRNEFVSGLRPLVECRVARDTDHIKATGLTATSNLIGRVNRLTELVGAITEILAALPNKIMVGVKKVLEDNAVAASSVTPLQLEAAIEKILHVQRQLEEKIDRVCSQPPPLPINPQVPTGYVHTKKKKKKTHQTHLVCSIQPVLHWGGRFRKVPESFNIPSCPLQTAFNLWFLGDEAQQHPPYRTLNPIDMGDDKVRAQKRKRRSLADLKSLMTVMENVQLFNFFFFIT